MARFVHAKKWMQPWWGARYCRVAQAVSRAFAVAEGGCGVRLSSK
eukprot:CAMPEP_0171912144 /NCGR_PEP_ID=MMETSP0993-20121228/10851_1 /TAXON_ID=483369 /ORGANISM="non described non described, Strain CCMP2098" /LENGTH=44 /DNA_ID= /DNA_START= /DNA_END= /DNA_ORIENTATION=